ncbi:hypothetical protein GCM10023203_49110 [Actinomycetospora straminea]|uniref:Uncharacterized protein n=1 Tax=Actinomycetospora straminea TaxID=663607 RepID=A0ABP9F123_9PSEU
MRAFRAARGLVVVMVVVVMVVVVEVVVLMSFSSRMVIPEWGGRVKVGPAA